LCALQITLRPSDLLPGSAFCGVCSSQLRREFRNFQDGESLALIHAAADIHINRTNVARHFGVYLDVLKRLECAGDRQGAPHVPPLHASYRGHRGSIRASAPAVFVVCRSPSAGAPSPYQQRRPSEDDNGNDPFCFVHFDVLREEAAKQAYGPAFRIRLEFQKGA
jgi:hypothetical protein